MVLNLGGVFLIIFLFDEVVFFAIFIYTIYIRKNFKNVIKINYIKL
jgi:hypothetical protein